jgi:hypothetical protein
MRFCQRSGPAAVDANKRQRREAIALFGAIGQLSAATAPQVIAGTTCQAAWFGQGNGPEEGRQPAV